MKGKIIALLLLAQHVALPGQVRVDKPLVLDGPSDQLRQVTGLGTATDRTSALSAQMEQRGAYRTAEVEAGSVWTVSLFGVDTPLVAGTHLVVRSPEVSSGPVNISVNGSEAQELRWGPGMPVDASELEQGMMLSMVHDGTGFQLMNGVVHTRRECPADMVAIDALNCIETTERSAMNFYEAAVACGQENKRLCTWAEFHLACEQRTDLGLQAMVNNWEWTNSGADHNFNLRVVGQSTCTASTRMNGATISNPFRCCYTR